MGYSETLWLYWLLVAGIILVPGMDMMLVLTNTLARGLAGGMAAVAGIVLGGFLHSAWGTLGAAFVLSLPETVTRLLYLAGGLYVGKIGVDLLRSSIRLGPVEKATRASLARGFRQGAVTSLLNPKAYVFVLAVMPQMVRPEFGPLWRQGAVLAGITMATQFAVYGAVALAAVPLGRTLSTRPRATILTGRAIGALFLAVAAVMVVEALR